MRVFWNQGGLQVQPEGAREVGLLAELMKCVRFEEPLADRTDSASIVCSCLGGEDLIDAIVAHNQGAPRNVPLHLRHKQTVVPIHRAK